MFEHAKNAPNNKEKGGIIMSYSQMIELLKIKHKGKILLVKTGAFYIATAEDAIFLHDTIGLINV